MSIYPLSPSAQQVRAQPPAESLGFWMIAARIVTLFSTMASMSASYAFLDPVSATLLSALSAFIGYRIWDYFSPNPQPGSLGGAQETPVGTDHVHYHEAPVRTNHIYHHVHQNNPPVEHHHWWSAWNPFRTVSQPQLPPAQREHTPSHNSSWWQNLWPNSPVSGSQAIPGGRGQVISQQSPQPPIPYSPPAQQPQHAIPGRTQQQAYVPQQQGQHAAPGVRATQPSPPNTQQPFPAFPPPFMRQPAYVPQQQQGQHAVPGVRVQPPPPPNNPQQGQHAIPGVRV